MRGLSRSTWCRNTATGTVLSRSGFEKLGGAEVLERVAGIGELLRGLHAMRLYVLIDA